MAMQVAKNDRRIITVAIPADAARKFLTYLNHKTQTKTTNWTHFFLSLAEI